MGLPDRSQVGPQVRAVDPKERAQDGNPASGEQGPLPNPAKTPSPRAPKEIDEQRLSLVLHRVGCQDPPGPGTPGHRVQGTVAAHPAGRLQAQTMGLGEPSHVDAGNATAKTEPSREIPHKIGVPIRRASAEFVIDVTDAHRQAEAPGGKGAEAHESDGIRTSRTCRQERGVGAVKVPVSQPTEEKVRQKRRIRSSQAW
jgi:hypothetical protein